MRTIAPQRPATSKNVLAGYIILCSSVFAGSELISGVLAREPMAKLARSTYDGLLSGVIIGLTLFGYTFGHEHLKASLRREFSYRYPRWRPTVGRIAFTGALGGATLLAMGALLRGVFRFLWGRKWNLPEVGHSAAASAIIGGGVGALLVLFEAQALERAARAAQKRGP